MSFLPSVECGKFELKKAFQSSKITACSKKPELCSSSTFKLIEMMLKCQVAQASSRRVARNSQWGGAVWGVWGRNPRRRRPMGVWGLSPQLPEAGGLGAKPPAAGGTGVWGQSPQSSKILHVFAKITSF